MFEEYIELSALADKAEREYEATPEDAAKEKAFDDAYKKQFNKFIACANYIVNCTGGKIAFLQAKRMLNENPVEVIELLKALN